MRSLHKSWQDRPHGWLNRVRWFSGSHDVRLEFCTPTGRRNVFYADAAAAACAWAEFIEQARQPGSEPPR